MKTDKLKGKKLLILAGGPNMTTLVNRAKEYGIYTIVTDYYDIKTSPAKKMADEYWNISWSDLEALEKKCKIAGINGITTGYSETPVEKCIELCKRLKLPCYCTQEQLDITRDKVRFKETCRKYGVPTVKEYENPEAVKEFPVIVKPVDRAGSIGVSVATCKEELEKAYVYAMELSYSKHVIIEKYMQARKVDFYYAIEAGVIQLLTSLDTINAQGNGFERVVQSGWLFPMKELSGYMKKVDSSIRRMIQGMGIEYGCIFFSGFIDSYGEFSFFECGFRMEGGHQYNYTEKKGLFNFLDLFIVHALTGNTELMERTGPINNDLKCAMVNIYAREGIIGEVSGFEKLADMENCCLSLALVPNGQACTDDKAILTKVGQFGFCSNSAEKLKEYIDLGYKTITVKSIQGKDMIYDRIDTDMILHWWE